MAGPRLRSIATIHSKAITIVDTSNLADPPRIIHRATRLAVRRMTGAMETPTIDQEAIAPTMTEVAATETITVLAASLNSGTGLISTR